MKAVARFRAAAALYLGLAAGCGAPPADLRRQLDQVGASDLADILAEYRGRGKAALLSDHPRFVVDTLQVFHGDTALVFQAYAALYFLYFRDLDLCQVRKYRYRTSARAWDRYSVELRHIPEKYVASGK